MKASGVSYMWLSASNTGNASVRVGIEDSPYSSGALPARVRIPPGP